jgi:hypothetical protein
MKKRRKRNTRRRILFTLALVLVVLGISAMHGWNYHQIQYEQYCSEWGIPEKIDEMEWLEPYTAAVIDDQLTAFRMNSDGDVNITILDQAGLAMDERSESLIKEAAIRNMFYMEPYLIYQTGDQIIAYAYDKAGSVDGNRHFGDPIFLTNEILGLEACASDPDRFLVYGRNQAVLYQVTGAGIKEDQSYISDKAITRARAEWVNGKMALLCYTDRSYAPEVGLTKNELILTDFNGMDQKQLTAVSSVLPVTLVNLNILNHAESGQAYVIYERKRSDHGVTSYSLEKITLDAVSLEVLSSQEIPTALLGKTIQAGYWDQTPYILTTGIYSPGMSGETLHQEGEIPCTANPNIRKNGEFMNLVTLEGNLRAPDDVHFFVSTYTNSVSPSMLTWAGSQYVFFKDVVAGSYGLMMSSNAPAFLEAHPLTSQDRTEAVGYALTAPVQVISSGIPHLMMEILVLVVALGALVMILTRGDRNMTRSHFYLYLAVYVVINLIMVYRFHYAAGPVANAPAFFNGPGAFLYVPLAVNGLSYGLISLLGRMRDYDEIAPVIYFIMVDLFLIHLIYIPFSQILIYLT